VRCSIRCVFVKVPSVSATCAAGKKEDLGLDVSSTLTSPLFTSGAVLQKLAVSCSQLSFTHEPLELAHRGAFQLRVERGRRILADAQHPFDLPGIHGNEHREMRVVAKGFWGCQRSRNRFSGVAALPYMDLRYETTNFGVFA